MIRTASRLCLALVALGTPSLAQDWPGWRGPNGDGTTSMSAAPIEWDAETNVRWRVPLDGPANGSPIVVGDRVLLTAPLDDEGKQRALQCFDRSSGERLWSRSRRVAKKMPTHVENPYCGTTPASDGERVVVWHASAGLWCYDLDGVELWMHDLGEFRHRWGYGTSPIIRGDRVVLHSGPGETMFVAAFAIETGEELWRLDVPNHLTADQVAKGRMWGSWCTPIVQRVGERDLVLCALPTRVVAIDLASGDLVWHCRGISTPRGDLTSASPIVVGDDCVILGAGVALAVGMDGEGDVTETHVRWRRELDLQNCGTGMLVDGRLLVADNNGQMWCIDPKTGETRWKTRVTRGGVWSSISRVGDRLYLTSLKGTSVVLEPNAEELVVIAENELDETTAASAAFSGGEVFVRTYEHLYCISGKSD